MPLRNSALSNNWQNSLTNQNLNSSKTESLKLILLNIQNIVAKRVSFAVLLDEYDPDIIAVSETLLSFDITTFEFFPNQYNVFRKEQVDSYGGVLFAR